LRYLILGLGVFLGTHSVRIFAEGWRSAQIARLGEGTWKGLFSAVSLAGFVLLAWGFGQARLDPVVVWTPPSWLDHLAGLLTLAAFVLLAAAYVPGTRIKAAVGHPMILGVKTWALAHLFTNGQLADIVLFGAFLAWAIADYASSRRRDRVAGRTYAAGPVTRDVTAVAIGIVAWAVFAFWLHGVLIGVRPYG